MDKQDHQGSFIGSFYPDKHIAQLSVNCVIFTYYEEKIKVAAQKIINVDEWLLPGGYIRQNENIDDAASRILFEQTGLKENIYLKQFHVFGDASRSFTKQFNAVSKKFRLDNKSTVIRWMSQRFATVGYIALVEYEKVRLRPGQFSESCDWLEIGKAKMLGMDHASIVEHARNFLIRELPYYPAAVALLPRQFTLPELHKLYEALLGRKIDRPNFRRKILSSEMLVKVGKQKSGTGRPADVYRFRNTSLESEVRLGF